MCGIAGFFDPGEEQPGLARAMGQRILHRGPDEQGTFVKDGVHLQHQRLSIVDLKQGQQPMALPGGERVVCYNGEVYNHMELRRQHFPDTPFTTRCDTEVLLHAHRRWGKEMCSHLNGMFAFCIYDREAQVLFFARDRLGQKPLYYTREGSRFAFASELGALLELPWVSRTLDPDALVQYYAHEHLPCPLTPFAGIRKLPPGHHMSFDLRSSELTIEPWWQAEFQPDSAFEDDRVALEAFEQRWTKALEHRMMSDVPLGIFLSGGVDSSSCLASLRKMHPDRDLETFSIGFSNKSFDESSYARRVADRFGSRHHEQILDPAKLLEVLPSIEATMLDPIADASIIPTTLLCRFARERVTVAIGGDAADELLCGYPTFNAHKALGPWAWPKPVVKGLQTLANLLPTNMDNISFDFKVKHTLKGLPYPPAIRNEVWLGAGSPESLPHFFHQDIIPPTQELYGADLGHYERCSNADFLGRIQNLYLYGYLSDGILVKVDRASMLHSLEVRTPFLDPGLLDLFTRLPLRQRLRGKVGKHLLKAHMRGTLPDEVIDRPKKGFGMPISHWFRSELKAELRDRIEALPYLFDRTHLLRLFDEHQRGVADHRKPLFSTFMLHPVLQVGRLP